MSCPPKQPCAPALALCLVATLCGALTLAGGAHADSKKTIPGAVVWQNGYEFVSVVPGEGRPEGRHPAKLPARALQRVLRNLRVRAVSGIFSDSSKIVPMLSERVADRLGKRLASALQRAKRGEDVLFRVGDSHNIIGETLQRRRFTAGRVFWYKNRLHIIFGGIQNSIGRYTLFGQDEMSRLTGEPEEGSRRSETELGHEVVPAPGVAYATKKRRDWVVVDPERVRARRARDGDGQGDRGNRGSVEERLTKLKRLYDRGLISEREYRVRQRELLDEL